MDVLRTLVRGPLRAAAGFRVRAVTWLRRAVVGAYGCPLAHTCLCGGDVLLSLGRVSGMRARRVRKLCDVVHHGARVVRVTWIDAGVRACLCLGSRGGRGVCV